MSYRRDFTIGLRETRGFYLMLVLEKWRRGIAGFGLVGALAAYLYTAAVTLAPWLQALAVLGGALAGMLASVLALTISTSARVRDQVRRSGQDSYVQQTEISGLGVHVTVGSKQAKMSFDKLVRVRETRRAFYLFIADTQAWILPKAKMEDRAAECRQIRQLFSMVMERGRLRLKKQRS